MQSKLKNAKGFTIVETMIVLAIAALILLIVFLAVPALQRASRNNGRKSDASRIASAVSDFVSNADGTLPCNFVNGRAQNPNDPSTIITNVGKLGQYTFSAENCVKSVTSTQNGQFSIVASASGYKTPSPLSDDTVMLVEGATCSDGTVTQGGARQAALMYDVEGGGTNGSSYSMTCIDAL